MTDKPEPSIYSDEETAAYREIWAKLSAAARETLRALIYNGPLDDGDVPSKTGRDDLLRERLASKAVVRREQGFQVATYKGWAVYRTAYPDMFASPSSLSSKAIRKASQP